MSPRPAPHAHVIGEVTAYGPHLPHTYYGIVWYAIARCAVEGCGQRLQHHFQLPGVIHEALLEKFSAERLNEILRADAIAFLKDQIERGASL